jgi:hypothetical protein
MLYRLESASVASRTVSANHFFVASGPLIWTKTSGRSSSSRLLFALDSLSSLSYIRGDVNPT